MKLKKETAEKLKKGTEANKQAIAEVALRTSLANSEPKHLVSQKKHEEKIRQDLKKMGFVTAKERQEILDTIKRTELFRKAAECYISDEELLDNIKEGLKAHKHISTKDDLIPVPDYTERRKYTELAMRVKNINTGSNEENDKSAVPVTINIINPNIST